MGAEGLGASARTPLQSRPRGFLVFGNNRSDRIRVRRRLKWGNRCFPLSELRSRLCDNSSLFGHS
jgi:hypothetical protein